MMIRTSLIALACLTTAPALAGEAVVLRETVTVEGGHVTLGDLFANAGDASEVVLARAPAPGSRTSIDVAYVQRIAAQHDLDWANAGGVHRVAVSRLSRAVSADMLTDMLEGELFARTGEAHEVQLSNSAMALHAPVGSVGGPQIVSLNFDSRSGMLAAEVAPYDGANPVRVTGRGHVTVDVPVLARPVAAGQTITEDDL
ncbi:MAG: hypothetical protein NZ658_07400, partial [Pirellulales bacterium]|nr:hypothetical protein [Pirellulales bacterium]